MAYAHVDVGTRIAGRHTEDPECPQPHWPGSQSPGARRQPRSHARGAVGCQPPHFFPGNLRHAAPPRSLL